MTSIREASPPGLCEVADMTDKVLGVRSGELVGNTVLSAL
jgi:hypothetical protein